MSVRLLLLGPRGTVTHASRTASELFTNAVGRACCDVVRATEASGAPICTSACAVSMIRTEGRSKDQRHAVIRGTATQLVCTPMGGGQAVITVLPDQAAPVTTDTLTPREREVLDLVAQGLTTPRIAKQLGISPATVRTHIEHAREKLGARTRAEAVARAVRR